jgi:hypothetical protein
VGSATPEPRFADATIVLTNQTVDNGTLLVQRASVPDGGFVVVHDSRYVFDGVPSPIGVSAYLPAGTHRDVRVRLSDGSVTNRTRGRIAAVVHRDDGDRLFEYVDNRSTDVPYRNATDDPVVETALLQGPRATTVQLDSPVPTTSRRVSERRVTSQSTAPAADDATRSSVTPRSGWSPDGADVIGLAIGGILIVCAALVVGITLRRR